MMRCSPSAGSRARGVTRVHVSRRRSAAGPELASQHRELVAEHNDLELLELIRAEPQPRAAEGAGARGSKATRTKGRLLHVDGTGDRLYGREPAPPTRNRVNAPHRLQPSQLIASAPPTNDFAVSGVRQSASLPALGDARQLVESGCLRNVVHVGADSGAVLNNRGAVRVEVEAVGSRGRVWQCHLAEPTKRVICVRRCLRCDPTARTKFLGLSALEVVAINLPYASTVSSLASTRSSFSGKRGSARVG